MHKNGGIRSNNANKNFKQEVHYSPAETFMHTEIKGIHCFESIYLFIGKQTHDLGFVSAVLFCLSYRNMVILNVRLLNTHWYEFVFGQTGVMTANTSRYLNVSLLTEDLICPLSSSPMCTYAQAPSCSDFWGSGPTRSQQIKATSLTNQHSCLTSTICSDSSLIRTVYSIQINCLVISCFCNQIQIGSQINWPLCFFKAIRN